VVLIFQNLTSGEKKIRYQLQDVADTHDPHFLYIVGHLLGPPIVAGNRVISLFNGKDIYPAMLKAIRSAQQTITFETYIYWSGESGSEFQQALCERAQAGVKVHVLLDWYGSLPLDVKSVETMEAAGVQVERYHPPRWYDLARINQRTHRKILVVDGKIGFIGGAGVADVWLGDADAPDRWRDTHFQVEGPVVAQLQAAFTDNWLKTHAVVFHHETYFPALENMGDSLGQVFKSSPREGSGSVRLMYLLSIAAAKKRIALASSYFVPDNQMIEALVKARRRGVEVEIIVPGPIIDEHVVRRASRARWGELLEAGVRIYEYQPTMFHCKVLVVDGNWVSVGSTNFDNRSFRLNDEANLNILDSQLAAEQEAAFAKDKSNSKEMHLKTWRRRPWKEKLIENAAALVRGQL
jgi:cardiolipin synthase